MPIDLLYYVELRADFRRPASFDEPAGEELAAILADGLPARGVRVLEVEGEVDYAHYVTCHCGDSTIELMISVVLFDESNTRWSIMTCAQRTFWGRKPVPVDECRTLLLAVNDVLHNCERVSDIRWYPGFETPHWLALMPYSPSPIPDPDYENRLHPLTRFDWRINRIVGRLMHPLGILGTFVLFCLLLMAFGKPGLVIVTVLFFAFMGWMTVGQFVLSQLVSRAGRLKHGGE